MNGRVMCEVYGAYGWSEGNRLMKWISDYMLVRGVNEFCPHAFDPKEYPDEDCPPHFYAHGINPQYREFEKLMRYTNRIAELLRAEAVISRQLPFSITQKLNGPGNTCLCRRSAQS